MGFKSKFIYMMLAKLHFKMIQKAKMQRMHKGNPK